jgi:hypothetical protein
VTAVGLALVRADAALLWGGRGALREA